MRLDQAHADQPPALIGTVDRVSVQLELAHNGGREVNPTVAQLGKSDRLIAGPVELLKHPLLLDVSVRHRWIVALQRAAAPHVVVSVGRALTQAFG